jgi:hypothetical protein
MLFNKHVVDQTKEEQMGNVCSTHAIAEDAEYFGNLGVGYRIILQ